MAERPAPPAPPPPARPLPARVTMPLLTLLTQQSLDEDYLEAAERRADPVSPGAADSVEGRRRRTAVAVVAIVAAFGILVTTAAVQTSRNAGIDDASRNTLVSRIQDRRESVSRLQDDIASLREENAGLEGRLDRTGAVLEATAGRLRRLQVGTGFIAVTGPGVRITVDEAPDATPEQRVRDEDLALLVDGLWNAGAEAIAINGRRLTALSALRNSGSAIRVNDTSLSPPYTVLAIGDPRTLQGDLLASTHGGDFFSLASRYQFIVDRENEDSMTLPAAPDSVRRLRSVTALPPGGEEIAP